MGLAIKLIVNSRDFKLILYTYLSIARKVSLALFLPQDPHSSLSQNLLTFSWKPTLSSIKLKLQTISRIFIQLYWKKSTCFRLYGKRRQQAFWLQHHYLTIEASIEKTYHTKSWIRHDGNVWLLEPKEKIYQCIEKLSLLLVCSETLFIIDDFIASKSLDKRR